jgi:hypothetical protein
VRESLFPHTSSFGLTGLSVHHPEIFDLNQSNLASSSLAWGISREWLASALNLFELPPLIVILKEPAMKKSSLVFALAASALIATFSLTPAIAADDAQHDHEHGAASTAVPADKAKPEKPQTSQGKPASTSEDKMGMMDMDAMCDMHKEMMSSKSKSERQAMMNEKMKGMSAADKKKQMKMMDEHCK